MNYMRLSQMTVIIIGVLFLSCEKNKAADPFLVQPKSIGLLTDSTQVKDLENVFINDSIYKYIGGDEFTGSNNSIDVFDNEGKLLLSLTPFEALDSTSTIKNIRVVDDRFKTTKGLSKTSTFKDISSNYKISSIQNTLRNLIVSVDDINAYFTIDKKELPAEMRFDMSLKIEAIQIPESAKISNFFIQWY